MNYREYHESEKRRIAKQIMLQGLIITLVILAVFYGTIWFVGSHGIACREAKELQAIGLYQNGYIQDVRGDFEPYTPCSIESIGEEND